MVKRVSVPHTHRDNIASTCLLHMLTHFSLYAEATHPVGSSLLRKKHGAHVLFWSVVFLHIMLEDMHYDYIGSI
jgi:hypothetical protein